MSARAWEPDVMLDPRWFMQPPTHPDWCAGCCRLEPMTPGCFVCGECFHVYPEPPADDVFSCEVCCHDF